MHNFLVAIILFYYFQNVVALAVMTIKWIVPNMSRNMRDKMRREAYVTNEIIIRTELLKAKGKLYETGFSDGGQGHNATKSENVDTGDVTDGRILNM